MSYMEGLFYRVVLAVETPEIMPIAYCFYLIDILNALPLATPESWIDELSLESVLLSISLLILC
jgi:hypothetical protein